MNIKKAFIPLLIVPVSGVMAEHSPTHQLDEMVITTSGALFPDTTLATPSFEIGAKDIEKVNLTTTEDIVRMAPGLQVRRRFIGDTNGVVASRGSTNFQTAHTMLFLDGIPLSNLTQTKWDGAPRWTQIAPNSIESIKVMYGPFSAQHSGGSFGSVIDVKTTIPEDFEMHMDATGFMQESDRFGRDETLWGHKEFISAGNRFGDVTVSGFFNHIENQGQPQMWDAQTLIDVNDDSIKGETVTPVTGGQYSQNRDGQTTIITGDSGIEESMNDLYSLKMSYDLTESLRAMFNINFEDFESKRGFDDLAARNYLRQEADGSQYWGTGKTWASQDGKAFRPTKRNYGASRYAPVESVRQTLSYGFNLSGQINDDWSIDTSASYFDAFKDLSNSHDNSSLDPADKQSGQLTDKEMWWATFDFKLATDHLFGDKDLGFMWGYQYNQADLNSVQSKYSSRYDTYQSKDAGGETQLHSGFAQMDYNFFGDFKIMAGARLDVWSASGGHDITTSRDWKTGELSTKTKIFDDRHQQRISPKASISWEPNEFSARYSFSRAYRFALAQELFESTSKSQDLINVADPFLGPENGNFHNLTFAYQIPQGLVSVDFFYNTIKDEIMNTRKVMDGGQDLSTFLGIDKTETIGVQMVYKQDDLFDLPLDLNLNGTWLDKQIIANSGREELVGKQWVRTSNWKANGSATYHITDQWDTTFMANYRGPQYANEDNSDNTSGVYGASDEYLLLNVKTQYKQPLANDMTATFSMGVDNLLNENYFDHHPYPQRTYFANVSLDI
jgi:iron complex outermembrane recepter protein